MNESLQRIKIAEACGWTFLRDFSNLLIGILIGNPPIEYTKNNDPIPNSIHIFGNRYYEIPYYTKNLNEMHNAENTLTLEQSSLYTDELIKINANDKDCIYPAWHCNAAQRAEAFLKALNLWKDDTLPKM